MVAHAEPPEAVLQSKEFAGAADLLVQVEHPAFGEHARLKPYIELSRSETLAEPGVLAGQHTDKILAELGYDAPAIASLKERERSGMTAPQQDGVAPAEPVLVSEQHGAVRVLRLNRPEARNALNAELIGALGAALVAAETDPDVRCVILTGTGDRAFCAGMDLRSFAAEGSPRLRAGEGAAGYARFTRGELGRASGGRRERHRGRGRLRGAARLRRGRRLR